MTYRRGLNHTTLNPAKGLRPRRERRTWRRALRALCPRIDFRDFMGTR